MVRKFKDYFTITLKGCAMGAADVVPGVSGGTIAFISGIYEELIDSIKSIDVTAIKLLLSFKIKDFWTKINGNFLFALICGVGFSIFSLAKLMTYLLETHPIYIWSFFFGLIIASSILVFKEIKKFNVASAISMIAGAAIAYLITVMTPAATPNQWWFIILTGAIAICAMILPGISGSFIMLLMGKYLFIMNAVSTFDVVTLGLFAIGALGGIISFSHLLSWLLKNFHTVTVSLLTGFMIGSLNKVWPWKEVTETVMDAHGKLTPVTEVNISPATYSELTGQPSLIVVAIVMCIVGFFTIYAIELISQRMKTEQK